MIWQRTHWRATLSALFLFGAAGAGALFALTAHADDYPGNHPSPLPQSTQFNYCFGTSFTTSASMGVYAMGNLDSQTDMYDTYWGTCNSSKNWVDGWWVERYLGNNVLGQRTCVIAIDSSTCDSADIIMSFSEIDECTWTTESRKKVATHELGHAVGLGHDSDSYAMTQGCPTSTSVTWRSYNDHDVDDHIDDTW